MMEKDKRRAVIAVTSVAFAPCPDCNEMVNLSATACPNCGRPIAPSDLPPPPEKRGFPVGMIIIGTIIVIIILMLANSAARRSDELERSRERWLEEHGR